jgi:hypothetical protein
MVMDPAMADEGFTRVTYELDERDGGATKLTVIHDLEGAPGLETLVSGGREDQGAGGGWSWVLSDLKSLLETGKRLAGPIDRETTAQASVLVTEPPATS